MAQNILGYHCNDKKRCEKFINENWLIWSNFKIDEQWLGAGMYFWDNLSNAKYWKSEKERKDKSKSIKFDIVFADIELSKFLDLTDDEVFCGVENYWKELSDQVGLVVNSDEVYIGEKLNYLFQYVDFFKENYNTIKIHAMYPKMTERNIAYKINPGSSPKATTKVRTIYTVKEKSAIVSSSYYSE